MHPQTSSRTAQEFGETKAIDAGSAIDDAHRHLPTRRERAAEVDARQAPSSDQNDMRRRIDKPTQLSRARNAQARRRGRGNADYIRGPISWPWMARVIELRCASAHAVALVCWYVSGQRRSRTFALPKILLERIGDRKTAYRGLAMLEQAGLLVVDRRRGRAAIVTIKGL